LNRPGGFMWILEILKVGMMEHLYSRHVKGTWKSSAWELIENL
jgi:hypothetical protein